MSLRMVSCSPPAAAISRHSASKLGRSGWRGGRHEGALALALAVACAGAGAGAVEG